MSWFGQSPPLHTEFHLQRWHCRIPIGNGLLYCPHNHPMKYSFFVSKYLSRRNRTDNNVSENGIRTHSHTHTHTQAWMVQCPLCLLMLEDFKGVVSWQPTSWGSCTVLWPSKGGLTRTNDSLCVLSVPQPKAATDCQQIGHPALWNVARCVVCAAFSVFHIMDKAERERDLLFAKKVCLFLQPQTSKCRDANSMFGLRRQLAL